MNSKELIDHFKLKPLQMEGGFFSETYRCQNTIPKEIFKGNKDKSSYSAIYYCLTSNTFSKMHRLPTDEIYHFYYGDPVQILILSPAPRPNFSVHTLGHDFKAGQIPQLKVPAYCWQGSKLIPGGEVALMGTTMAPGFDFEDFEEGNYLELLQAYPTAKEWLKVLCDVESQE